MAQRLQCANGLPGPDETDLGLGYPCCPVVDKTAQLFMDASSHCVVSSCSRLILGFPVDLTSPISRPICLCFLRGFLTRCLP